MKGKTQFIFTLCLLHVVGAAHSQDPSLDPLDYFLQAEIDQANTAKEIDYLTKEEKDIYLYTNLVRLFPKKFYVLYKDFVIAEGKEALLKDNSYYTTLTTDLNSREAVTAVYPNTEMFALAECWAIESGKKGVTGHDRMECSKGHDGENCAYGVSTGIKNVMLLLIDYGVQSLGHRLNLLDPDWRGMGAAIRPHRDFGMCAVQDFSRTNDLIKEEGRKKVQNFNAVIEGWDKREFKSADVNRKAKHLNDLEKDFYLYVNLMRVNPRKFKEEIWNHEKEAQSTAEYKMISQWLESTEPLDPIEPDEKIIAGLKCFINSYFAKSNSSGCFRGLSGSSRLRGYYSESRFDGVMSVLLTPGDFDAIVVKKGVVALQEGDPSIIAFFEK